MRTLLVAIPVAAAMATALVTALPGVASADGTITWSTANSVAAGDQDNAAVSVARTGYTAIVWEDDRDSSAPEDSVHSEIFLRLYRDGASVFEKKLSSGGSGSWRHVQPDVAVREDGTSVVVWADDPDGNGYYNIAVRAVSASGAVTGSARANADASGQQVRPAVAADPDGPGFAVAFEDQQGSAAPTVRVSGYALVSAKSYEVAAHAAGGRHQRPDVAMGAAGNAIVVWDEDGDGNGYYNIARKVLTPTGGVKLGQALANANAGGQQRAATVAANVAGDFAVAWETDHTGTAGVAARSFTATGAAGPETQLPGAEPQVGVDDQRSVFVAWLAGTDVHGQGLNPDGTATGRQPRLSVHPDQSGKQAEPAAAVDAWGRVTLAFTDDRDGNGYDQVYLGTGLVNSTW